MKQMQDHVTFGFFQTNSTLQTKTTNMCQALFESHPQKSLAKFKNIVHAAISSNTLSAPICQLHTCF
jgi:hypothetical protein